jgi:hypothetical protein
MSSVPADRTLGERLAQSLGARPLDVLVRFVSGKRRRELLRHEALRQAEMRALDRERQLRLGELWAPVPGSRVAREWHEVRQQLQREGLIDG